MDELLRLLRLLKVWAGSPSYETITTKVNALWRDAGLPEREWKTYKNTVAACFAVGRRRPNDDLILGIVEVLNPDVAYISQWRQALRIVRGEAEAATFVEAQPCLPDDIVEFTGRENELTDLTDLLDAGVTGTTVVISAIEGMAGVGKTQLAVHAGHHLQQRYRFDQVLFVNLRGFHADPLHQPPADPAAVLDSFLRLLGVPGQEIPHDLEGRAKLYRKQFRDQRVLVVLDNAGTATQVQPLLPDSPNSLTLITSRLTLVELPNAQHLLLDVFTPAEALEFLRRTIGTKRVNTEHVSAAQLCAAVGHLPLALGLASARVLDPEKSNWNLADHVIRLQERREALRLDDDVEVSFRLSYDDLPVAHRHLLRMLSLHPGQDLDLQAAAALTNIDADTAQRYLDHLLASNLLQQKSRSRYELHDLVRAYARARAQDEDRQADRQAALARLTDRYLQMACSAMDLAYPHEKGRRDRIATPTTALNDFTGDTAAREWLDTERANLLAISIYPDNIETTGVAVVFSAVLHRHLITGAHYIDARTLHEYAISVADSREDRAGHARALINLAVVCWRTGDNAGAVDYLELALDRLSEIDDLDGEAYALSNLGTVFLRMGRHEDGVANLQRALSIFQELQDLHGQAQALGNLGSGYELRAEYPLAAEHFRQARAIFGKLRDLNAEAHALTNLGVVYWRLGKYELAESNHRRAFEVFSELDDRYGRAHALTNLGATCEKVGNCEEAVVFLGNALNIFRELGDRDGENLALTKIGSAYARLGQLDKALLYQQQGVDLAKSVGDPSLEAEALNGLGWTLRAVGRLLDARSLYDSAQLMAREAGHRYEQARALDGLAHIHLDTADVDLAREHWQAALALYEELGVPDANDVRLNLVRLAEK